MRPQPLLARGQAALGRPPCPPGRACPAGCPALRSPVKHQNLRTAHRHLPPLLATRGDPSKFAFTLTLHPACNIPPRRPGRNPAPGGRERPPTGHAGWWRRRRRRRRRRWRWWWGGGRRCWRRARRGGVTTPIIIIIIAAAAAAARRGGGGGRGTRPDAGCWRPGCRWPCSLHALSCCCWWRRCWRGGGRAWPSRRRCCRCRCRCCWRWRGRHPRPLAPGGRPRPSTPFIYRLAHPRRALLGAPAPVGLAPRTRPGERGGGGGLPPSPPPPSPLPPPACPSSTSRPSWPHAPRWAAWATSWPA